MTGVFIRVEREGKWLILEVEYLTKEELHEFFLHKPYDEMIRWIYMLTTVIGNIQEGNPL
jgi:hypothetical protein